MSKTGEREVSRYNYHNNDIGDWCPWSHCSASVKAVPGDPCPARCRKSKVEIITVPANSMQY